MWQCSMWSCFSAMAYKCGSVLCKVNVLAWQLVCSDRDVVSPQQLVLWNCVMAYWVNLSCWHVNCFLSFWKSYIQKLYNYYRSTKWCYILKLEHVWQCNKSMRRKRYSKNFSLICQEWYNNRQTGTQTGKRLQLKRDIPI